MGRSGTEARILIGMKRQLQVLDNLMVVDEFRIPVEVIPGGWLQVIIGLYMMEQGYRVLFGYDEVVACGSISFQSKTV